MNAPTAREAEIIRRILSHEGGFVNNPRDPGGATNRGVTLGTLRGIGMDIDGDGDVDISDIKALTEADAIKIYKMFYADPVRAQLLPRGLDYVMTDFAVNSGPKRAAEHLQRALRLNLVDGDIGPATMAAVAGANARALINAVCDSRLIFMQVARDRKGQLLWPTFGKGWQRRVDEVRAAALKEAA